MVLICPLCKTLSFNVEKRKEGLYCPMCGDRVPYNELDMVFEKMKEKQEENAKNDKK